MRLEDHPIGRILIREFGPYGFEKIDSPEEKRFQHLLDGIQRVQSRRELIEWWKRNNSDVASLEEELRNTLITKKDSLKDSLK